MACNISDEGLYEFADRVAGQTVVITGAGRGIGREAALEFAKRRANLVIGDIDLEGAEKTATEAKRIGGNSAFQSCDVLVYDDLVSLFQLALLKFGQVDVVIANAGVSEIGRLTDVRLDEQGLPKKPAMKTLEVNLISVLYTTQLAFHYLGDNRNKSSLRTLVLISSILGFVGLPGAPIYSASKHAVLALMRSLAPEFQMSGLRIAGVFPWFADTAILTASEKDFMTGIPMVPLPRVAGAIFLAATDGAPDTHGGAYTCPDDREVFRIPHTEIAENVYELLSNRMKRTRRKMETVQTFLAFASVFARTAAAKLLMGLVFGFVAYLVAHRRNSQ